ncbi:hypothetical protein [Desulfobulbus alkaliphilus]|nr:hypothetical protein [Desulfobulbus alkaliphilus]
MPYRSIEGTAHHGVLNAEVHFIQKPFSMQKLAIAIRTVFEQGE